MKKTLSFVVLAMAMIGCRAQVRVQATAAPPPEPPKQEEPTPEPEMKAGEEISLPDQIEFEVDQARIKQTPKTLETLQRLAEIMTTHKEITKLRIEGHTDDRGSTKHNDRLSKQRAAAVAKWLAQHDVAESRLVTVGYGEGKPKVPNDSAANRAQNRRTEYYIEEVEGKKVDDSSSQTLKVASGTSSGGKTAE